MKATEKNKKAAAPKAAPKAAAKPAAKPAAKATEPKVTKAAAPTKVAAKPAAKATASKSKVSHAQIAAKAYEIYVRNGCQQGKDLENWMQAEKELKVK